MRRLVSFIMVATAGLALLVLAAPAAFPQTTTTASSATGLTNDHFADATVINTVPFSVNEDASQATFDPSDPSDPSGCSNRGSVWFAYTPTSEGTIDADTFGSSYDTVLSAWTGTEGALTLVACNDDFGTVQSRIDFKATPGTTYYFMVARCCGIGGDGGGLLTFSLDQIDPAALAGNDAFADATPIASLPFSDTVDLSRSTIEPSERSPFCVIGMRNSVWYAFTPATTEFVTATVGQSGVGVGVETGSSLTNLNEIGCIQSPDRFTFRAQANTTYYFQVGGFCCDGFGPITFGLDVAPDPVSDFDFVPRDPSSLDTVQFYDFAYDPAGAGISSLVWRFGDGATTTGSIPTHQYTQDGDYTAELTVTTPDGRTSTTSQVVQVRTRDVAIMGIEVPKSARVGQVVEVKVDVANKRYPETVQVDLYTSSPGGFQQVGSLTKPVPVGPGGAVTRFAFRYTITQADGTAGQLTFTAQASILDHRDAILDNNELSSTPVRIV